MVRINDDSIDFLLQKHIPFVSFTFANYLVQNVDCVTNEWHEDEEHGESFCINLTISN